MSIPKLHKQRTSRLDNRETPDTIQSAKQERSRRSIALYNNRIFTEEKNNIRVQFLLTSAFSVRLMRKSLDFSLVLEWM